MNASPLPAPNIQTLCDACGAPDAISDIQQATQEATSRLGFIHRVIGKLDGTMKIVGVLRELTDEKIHQLGGVEAVKKLVGQLYDTYVAPIDLPYIPNLVEDLVVDPALRKLCVAAVDAVHEHVHGE